MQLAAVVTVLLLHSGGFTGGDPSQVAPFVDDLRAAGYNAVAVDYRHDNPTGNILGEIASVRRVARDAAKRGPVVAYGMSAGATLAAALAATGEVDGAVVAGGPTNLLNWICVSPYLTTARFWRDVGMDRNARRLASPVFRLNGHQSPQLLQYGDIDPLVPIDQGLQYFEAAVKGQPDTSFQLMPISPHTYPAAYRVKAREWIQARWPIRPPLRLAR